MYWIEYSDMFHKSEFTYVIADLNFLNSCIRFTVRLAIGRFN